MEEVVKALRISLISQLVGLICAFVAYWIPGANDSPLKNGLFVFGVSLILGYWLYILTKVYKVLKNKN